MLFVFLLSSCFLMSVLGSRPCPEACHCQEISARDITVHCSGQSLTGVPQGIPNDVSYLDVSMNSIRALTDRQFGAYRNLTRLDISSNQVAEVRSWTFQKISSLEELDLGNNALQIVTSFMFSQATNLKLLSLGNNVISRIEAFAFADLSLDRLSLQGNAKLTTISEDAFRNCRINTVVLDRCGISVLPAGLLQPLSESLSVLSVSDMMHGLRLEHNSMANLSLDILHLVQDNLTEKDLGFMASARSIKDLDLSRNRFQHFDLSLLQDTNTSSLTINSAGISSFTSALLDKKSGHIKSLDIRNNSLQTFPVALFRWIPNLRTLNIAGNPISTMTGTNATTLDKLHVLDITNVSMPCDCTLAWFQRWRKATSTHVYGSLCSTRQPADTVDLCVNPHQLMSWVQTPTRKGVTSQIYCSARGYPIPNVTIARVSTAGGHVINTSASGGEVRLESYIESCVDFLCTAYNEAGTTSHVFSVCPSHTSQVAPPSPKVKANWVVTFVLSGILALALVIACVVVMTNHRRIVCKKKLLSGSGYKRTFSSGSSTVTLDLDTHSDQL